MLESFWQSFGAAIWAFSTQDSKYSVIMFNIQLDYSVCTEMSPFVCFSVCHHRDHRDLCVRWIPQVFAHAQGPVHSGLLRVLLHHGLSYDHSGNHTAFGHHCLCPAPLCCLLSSCTSCKMFSWILHKGRVLCLKTLLNNNNKKLMDALRYS